MTEPRTNGALRARQLAARDVMLRRAALNAARKALSCPLCGYLYGHAPDCPVVLREERKRALVVVFLFAAIGGAVAALVAHAAGWL